MNDKINVMIVEDQSMPRQLFEAIIGSQPRFNLAVSIDNAAIADICCARHDIDLVLMDVVTKNGASGLVAAEKIKAENKNVKIVIVTSMPECSYIERAKKIGVEGFWYKDFSVEPILSLIERVLNGERVYPDEVPEIRLGLAKSCELTARELEILREMTGGFTNAEIAEKFGISEKRVRNHVANMLEKTGFRSRTELAVRARESGLTILDRTEDDL
ncbi:MAG: response regulator transcription factor [Christensenellales bacterium]